MIAAPSKVQEWRYLAWSLVYALPIYKYTLGSTKPGRRISAEIIGAIPPDPWPGQAARGAAILKGEFAFYGELAAGARLSWRSVGMSERWLCELHSFAWLRDLRALGGDPARRRARELTVDWLQQQATWHRLSWRPDVLGRRLFAWLGSYDFFCASATDEFRDQYFTGIIRQGRHLSRALPGRITGEPLLAAIKGLIVAGLAVRGHEKWVDQGLTLLERELDQQILADGGHVSRNPGVQLQVLQHMVDLRNALSVAGREAPPGLLSAIDRAAPFVRMLRHGDGKMALFNGSSEGQAWLIDMVLTHADARGRAPGAAPHTGFQRLAAGRSVMLFDVGPPAENGAVAGAHAGTLGFELSIGKDRVIVNCGARQDGEEEWVRVQRSTAAHSTLVIEDTNSSHIVGNEHHRRSAPPARHSRTENAGNIWLSGTHDGYADRYGLSHRRCVYMASVGDDIRGEDTLILAADTKGKGGCMAHSYKVRFHLHPSIRAHKDTDGNIIVLRLPTGGTWRFRVDGGSVHIADGIYLGADETPGVATRQIVVSGVTGAADSDNIVANIRWGLERIAVAQSVDIAPREAASKGEAAAGDLSS